MADELIDICDENDNVTGQAMKSEAWEKGLRHRVARVLIYKSNGEIFAQLRSENKELHPGLWDIGVAGHVAVGEDYIDAAVREMAEEAGLAIQKENLELLIMEKEEWTLGNISDKIFACTYLARFEGDISEIRIQAEELQAFRFVDIDKLEAEKKMFPEKFTPHTEEYWSGLINGVRNKFKTGSE